MTGVGCGIGGVNSPQHSIKKREKCGLTLFHRLSAAQVAQLRSLEMPRGPVMLHFDRVALYPKAGYIRGE
jgi:hypothetical protein